MLQDKFIPAEGLNSIFVDILNCDIVTRPSQQGFLHPLYYLKKRGGLETINVGGVNQWQTVGNIAGGSYSNLKIYPYTKSGYLYKFDGSILTNLLLGAGFNEVDYSYKTIDVSFGGNRYPDQYTRFTVASYDAINAEITINETLTAGQQIALVDKYVYIKTGAGQWGFRKISTIPSSTKIKLTSGFGVAPGTGDTIFIYDTLISHTLYSQLRELPITYYKFYAEGIVVSPTAGATYTNSTYTFTVVSTDISGGKGTITTTGTGAPGLSGTLTKSAGTGDATITFYDSDNGGDRLVAKDSNDAIKYLYFPNDRKLVKWDNKLMGLHKNRQNILPHDTQDIEIISTTKIVNLGTAQALNIDVFSGYLIVFFEDKIGILKKVIVDASTQDYVYQYQDLLGFGLFSENSYIIYGGNFYIYANDNRLYSISISSSSGGDVLAKAEDQGTIMVNYFSNITSGDVRFTYASGVLRIVHDDGVSTKIYKYIENYKARIRDTYTQYGNLFVFQYNIGGTQYTCYNNSLYSLTGNQDIGVNIKEQIRIYGPVQMFNDIFKLTAFKIRIGFDGESKLGGKLKCNVGGSTKYYIERDISDLDIVDLINQYIVGGGMMGGGMMGDYLMGGRFGIGNLSDYFAEFIDLKFVIGKEGSWFDLIIENEEDSQLYFGGAIALYTANNPEVLYVKNTI